KYGFKNLFDQDNNGLEVKLNPKAVSFVQDYIKKETADLNKMKSWSKPYFDVIDNILVKYGLPVELKYLSVIESELKPYAISWAGAVGPWQFMPATARAMGLRVSRYIDERTDFHKSTHAAARYLNNLFRTYGDWLLVIAAYNGGPGRVDAAIRKSKSRNFWNLQYHLPAESRNHVKKFIATHYIMEGDGGIATQTKSELADQLTVKNGEASGLEPLLVSGKYNSLIIAQHIQMDITEFNKLNPNFDKQLAANNSYNLRLPAEKTLLFQANKQKILESSVRLMLMAGNK
ncbi:MAG TPA: lytic transglycosylase domain-containing protein, partial [Chitinophagaceae bacterium]|nr:lytic transglycosylase domain-containing protein [Chitinophagaceae bacterium]